MQGSSLGWQLWLHFKVAFFLDTGDTYHFKLGDKARKMNPNPSNPHYHLKPVLTGPQGLDYLPLSQGRGMAAGQRGQGDGQSPFRLCGPRRVAGPLRLLLPQLGTQIRPHRAGVRMNGN